MIQEGKIKVFGDIYFYPPQSTVQRPIETLFTSLPKAEQYWRRQTDFVVNKNFPNLFFDYDPHLPEKKRCRINAIKTHYTNGRLTSVSTEDTLALTTLVKRELTRMKRGVYMMNNGVKIYLPGYYYGTLQWVKMMGVSKNDGYGDHKRYQREFACQRKKCIEDPKIDAYYLDKIKKCGGTQLASCFDVVEMVTNTQFNTSTMSKNHDTAKSANFAYFTYGLKNLPKILLPTIEQSGWMGAPQKITIRSEIADLSLQNTIIAVPTKSDALDGLPPQQRIKLSEMPKMANAETILKKSREQAKLQTTKVGLVEIESYPPEDDTDSFRYCKNLYTKDCMDLDDQGYPKNGIIPLYIGLLEATNGTHDIYGEPDRTKAYEMEMTKREACDTPAKLQVRKRQYHVTIKESWESGGGGSVYNNIALTEQQARLEDKYVFGELNYRWANLEWTAGFGSEVRIVFLSLKDVKDGKTGRWRVFVDDNYISKNTNLCFRQPRRPKKINGEIVNLLQPPKDLIHPAGTDPVDYGYVSELGKVQSKNSSIIRKITGELVSVYHNRDEDPDNDLENFCMEMLFWGTHSIVEGNRKNAVTTLQKLGMYYFMLIKHPNGEIVPFGQPIKIKHVSSGKDLKAKYIELITKHIKNNIEFFQDVPTIEQHKDFDAADTQKYDLAVSDGLSFIAVDAMQTWLLSKKNTSDRYAYMGAAIAGLG